MKKTLVILILSLSFFLFLPLSSVAQDFVLDEEDLSKLLPEEYAEYFQNGNGEITLPSITVFFKMCFREFSAALKGIIGDFSKIAALTILASVLSLFEHSVKGEKSKGVLRLCVLLSAILAIAPSLSSLFSLAETHLQKLCGYLSAIIPLLNGVQLSMGALSSASVTIAALSLLLSLIGELCCGMLLPFQKLCFALDLSAAITENKGLSLLTSKTERLFLFLLGGLSAFLMACFSLQNIVSAKTDSAAIRAFRFTAGGLVPLVGSALSESSRVLLSGLELLKSTIGGIGIAVILVTLLGPLLKLFLSSFCFSLAASLAKTTEQDLLSTLFSKASFALNCMSALIILCDLSAVFAIAITLSQSIR